MNDHTTARQRYEKLVTLRHNWIETAIRSGRLDDLVLVVTNCGTKSMIRKGDEGVVLRIGKVHAAYTTGFLRYDQSKGRYILRDVVAVYILPKPDTKEFWKGRLVCVMAREDGEWTTGGNSLYIPGVWEDELFKHLPQAKHIDELREVTLFTKLAEELEEILWLDGGKEYMT